MNNVLKFVVNLITIVNNNILVSMNGKDFKCDCSCNVFSKTNKNAYICHGCGNVYKIEEK